MAVHRHESKAKFLGAKGLHPNVRRAKYWMAGQEGEPEKGCG